MVCHVRVDCPGCGGGLRARSEHLGRHIRCRRCRLRFRAPEQEGATDAASSRPVPADEPIRIELGCPGCLRVVRVRAGYIGRDVQCRRCGRTFLARLAIDPGPSPPSEPHGTALEAIPREAEPEGGPPRPLLRTPRDHAAAPAVSARIPPIEVDEARERERAAEAGIARAESQRLEAERSETLERLEADRLRRRAESLHAALGRRERSEAALRERGEELIGLRADLAEAGRLLRETCDRAGSDAEELRRERDAACELALSSGRERDRMAARCEQAVARADELATLSEARAAAAEAALAEADRRRRVELEHMRRELLEARERAGEGDRRLDEAKVHSEGLRAELERLGREAEAGRRELLESLEDWRGRADAERLKRDEDLEAARGEHEREIRELAGRAEASRRIASGLGRERDEAAGRAEAAARDRDDLAGRLAEALTRAREGRESAGRRADELGHRLLGLQAELERSRREGESARAGLELAAASARERSEAARPQADRETGETRGGAEGGISRIRACGRGDSPRPALDPGLRPVGREVIGPAGRPADPEAKVIRTSSGALLRGEGLEDGPTRRGDHSLRDLALEQMGDDANRACEPPRLPGTGGGSFPPVGLPAGGDAEIGLGGGPSVRNDREEAPAAELGRMKREVELLHEQGRLGEAIAMSGLIVDMTRGASGVRRAEHGVALMLLASLLLERGDLDEAELLHERAEEAFRATVGEGHPAYALCLFDAACLHEARGDAEAARRLYERAEPAAIRSLGERHPIRLRIMRRLADAAERAEPPAPSQGAICAGAAPMQGEKAAVG